MKPRFGIVGVGHLAERLVEGLYRGERAAPDFDLVLSPRNERRVAALRARFPVRVGGDNQEVVDAAGVVVLALRPPDVVQTARALRFEREQVVVSVAAGSPLGPLARAVRPARAVRAMPVLSASLAASPTALHPDDAAARSLLERLGTVHAFAEETRFEAAAVMATYYGWLLALMDEVRGWLAERGVAAATAHVLVAQMTRAAAELCASGADDMGAAARAIARPGSYTALGLEALERRAGLGAWRGACDAVLEATRRAGG